MHDVRPNFGMWYIDDERYLPGFISPENEEENRPRYNNLMFFQYRYPPQPINISGYTMVIVQALCSTGLGKEVPVHHGNQYKF